VKAWFFIPLAIFALSMPRRAMHAQQATALDTAGIVNVVAARARVDSVRDDSLRRDACQSSGIACDADLREATWYLSPPAPFAAALARAQNRSTRAVTDTLPACPWRTAVAEPGYRAHAELRALGSGSDSVEVVLAFRCDNPRGFLHDFYERDESVLLVRREGVWQIISVRTRVT
jgi:hypothetical protein